MFIKSRRRLVGLLAALAVPTLVGALALPANGVGITDPIVQEGCTHVPNLVTNCGFEAGPNDSNVVPGWNHIVSNDAFVWNNLPHTGTYSLAFGSGSTDDVFTQTIKVSPHSHYLVSAWVNAQGGGTNDFGFAATNITNPSLPTDIYSGTNISTAGWFQVGGTVTTGAGTTMTLVLRGANPPAHTYVDDIEVIPTPAGCAPIANNRVANCGFEAGTPSPWNQVGTNHASGLSSTTAWSGNNSLRFASTSGDDTWQQVLSTRPKTQYRLSYWVEYTNHGAIPANIINDLHVSVSNVPAAPGGALKINTSNRPDHFWAQVTATFTTGTGSGSVITIAGANKPGWTYVDDVSVTAVPLVKIAHSGRVVTTTLNGVGGQKVYLEKKVGTVWKIVHTWTAPTTGYTKSWALTVGSGGYYRSVAATAPGYSAAASAVIHVS